MFSSDNIINIRDTYLPLYAISAIIYLPIIFGIQYYVSTLPLGTQKYLTNILTTPYILWNSALSIFSGIGTFYLGKHLLYNEYNCSITDGDTGFWCTLFILSKLPELIDTIFIVLRSKPLIFLHFYHHLATIVLSYLTLYTFYRGFLICALMNYFIHTIMYAYYAIYAMNMKWIRHYGLILTTLQFTQMIIAIYFCARQFIENSSCVPTYDYMGAIHGMMGIIIYISYAYLFGELLIEKKIRDKKNF